MASTTINKPYSDKTLEMLLKIIEQGKEYDIEIDKTPIISRTDNTELFYDFMDYLEPTARYVAIRIYRGNSRNYDRTVLILPQNSLNGFPLQEAQEAYESKPKLDIAKEKSDWEKDRKIEDLTEEVEYLTKKLKTVRRKAEEKIQEIKDSQSSLSGVLETLAPAAIQVLSNSKLSKTYPALGMLSSLNEEPQEPNAPSYNAPVSEVKFSSETEHQGLTDLQKKELHFFEQLKKNFQDFELATIFDFLKRAAKDKQLLETLIPTENEF